MGDADLGNVVLSKPFQFVEIQQVVVDKESGEDIFTPSLPTKLAPIKDRYIYAFELGERDGDLKPILAAEYYADDKGKLSFLPGSARRKVEPKPKPSGHPVPAAALALVRQGKRLRHMFVALRGPASKRVIMEMENALHPVYERVHLADDFYFKTDASGTAFLPIIDPLTLGEQLNVAYQKALNDAINYSVPYKGNPDHKVELRARKYHLAGMIKNALLEPEGHHDPLELHGHLAGGGRPMLNWMDEHESTLRRLDGQRHYRVNQLIRMLNSRIWLDAFGWYLGTKEEARLIGHCWLDATFCSIDRTGETPEGRRLQAQLLRDADRGLLSYLFAPEVDADEELQRQYEERFAIMRKAATAAVIGFAEMAPALSVYKKVRQANKRVYRTFKRMFASASISLTEDLFTGAITAKLKVRLKTELVRVELPKAKLDLEKWIEEGKPHWPERTKKAEVAELMGRIFIGVESLNAFNAVRDFFGTMGGEAETGEKLKASVELFGASLDLAVAAEDPIRAYAHQLDELFKKPPLPGAEIAHAAGSAHEEAVGVFGKIAKPIVFKGLGVASALIDTVIYSLEGMEDLHHGDRQSARAHFTVAGGSALLVIGSGMAMWGYATQAAALTAAAASLIVVAVVVVAVGFFLVHIFSKTPWQKFARHSIFGEEPGGAGQEAWSGGPFAKWTETVGGIETQIQALTAMLCSFKVKGGGLDDYAIFVDFGAVLPRSKLELEFTYSYENGREHKPRYVVDLDTGDREYHGDARHESDFALYRDKERLMGCHLRAEGPPFQSRIRHAECAVRIQYAPGTGASVASGKIPIARACDYLIRDSSWGMGHMEARDSLEVGPHEGGAEHEGGATHGGGATHEGHPAE